MQMVKKSGSRVLNFPPLAVVILAGGQSIRMGTPKANLKTPGGITLLDRANSLGTTLLSTLKQKEGQVFVSGVYPGYRSIPDLISQCGPLSGLHAAVDHCLKNKFSQYLLAIPVDMPALSIPVLLRLLQFGLGKVAAHFNDYEMPLLLKVNEVVLASLETMLTKSETQSSSRSIREFLNKILATGCEAPYSATSEFVNLNTPLEFEGWISGAAE